MAVQLQQLRTRIRERADMENTTFVTDAELDVYANQSLTELYDHLVAAYGADYFVTEYAFVTVADQADYPLPTTFYKLSGLDLTVGGIDYTLERFMFRERNRWQSASPVLVYNSNIPNFRYRIVGANLRISPVPTAVYNMTLHHVPRITPLVLDADEVANEILDGWTEYVVIDCAIRCLIKEESDVTALTERLAMMRTRIENMAPDRDAAEPERVVDIEDIQGNHWGRTR